MRHNPQFLISLIALLLMGALSCMPLTQQGATVRVIVGDPANECTEVGTVTGIGMGQGAQSDNWAKNDLRDSAASKGATHVRIEGKRENALGDTEISGVAFRCPEPAPPAQLN